MVSYKALNTIGEGVLSYACQCVRKLDTRQRLAVTEGLEADVSDTVGDLRFPDSGSIEHDLRMNRNTIRGRMILAFWERIFVKGCF